MLNSFQAAKKLGEVSDWNITNLQLQKLLYMSHMFFLGRYQEPLVNETFEAWNLGPVLPSVYHRLKIFGNQNIRDIFNTNISKFQEDKKEEFSVIEKVYAGFKEIDGYKLVAMTHRQNGGWDKNFKPRLNATIPDSDILGEYNEYYNK